MENQAKEATVYAESSTVETVESTISTTSTEYEASIPETHPEQTTLLTQPTQDQFGEEADNITQPPITEIYVTEPPSTQPQGMLPSVTEPVQNKDDWSGGDF